MTYEDILFIDGVDYDVPIVDYEIDPKIVDGPGTDRMSQRGQPMFRDPQGTFVNITITYGLPNTENGNFQRLWNKILSLGVTDFINVKISLPGLTIEQKMYCSPGKLSAKRFKQDGVTYYTSWTVAFIGQRALIM